MKAVAGRKAKVTNDEKARKYQRERTENMQKHDASLQNLQPTPPRELVGVARQAYTKIVNDLNASGVIKQIDINVVVALCKQIQINRSAYEHIYVGVNGSEPEGIQTPIYKAVQGPDGKVKEHLFMGYKKNPAVQTLDSSTAKIKSLCETLGMTPSSRASLLSMTSDDDDDATDISDVFKNAQTDF